MGNVEDTKLCANRVVYHGHAGTQQCGDWCRHFDPLDQDLWPGYGRCVHPLSLRSGQVFRVGHECMVGEAPMA